MNEYIVSVELVWKKKIEANTKEDAMSIGVMEWKKEISPQNHDDLMAAIIIDAKEL